MKAVGLNPDEVGGGVAHVFSGPQEVMGIRCEPLAVVVQECAGSLVYLSRWEPSDNERQAIADGADVLLYVFGGQPPVTIGVVSEENG